MLRFFTFLFATVMSLFGVHYGVVEQPTSTPIVAESAQIRSNVPATGVKANQQGQNAHVGTGSTLNGDGTTNSTDGDKAIQDVLFFVSSFEHNTGVLIKDPNGKEVGYDAHAGDYIVNQIPDVAYCLENGYAADVLGGPGQSTGDEECDIQSPVPGAYTVSVLGKSGAPFSYELDTQILYADGSTDVKSHYGTSTPGSIDNYSIQIGKQ